VQYPGLLGCEVDWRSDWLESFLHGLSKFCTILCVVGDLCRPDLWPSISRTDVLSLGLQLLKKRSPWHPSRVFTSFINKGVLELLHIDVRRICLPPCFNVIVVKSREVSTSSHLCTMFLRISMAVLPSGSGWVVLGSICWWSIGEVVWNLEYSWLSF